MVVPRLDVLLIVALAAWFSPAFAQDTAGAQPPDPATEPAPRPPPSDAISYRLVVEGPNPPANAIREGLDLARWQTDPVMSLDLLERLAREAVPHAQEIAAIQVFYAAKVDITIDREAK